MKKKLYSTSNINVSDAPCCDDRPVWVVDPKEAYYTSTQSLFVDNESKNNSNNESYISSKQTFDSCDISDISCRTEQRQWGGGRRRSIMRWKTKLNFIREQNKGSKKNKSRRKKKQRRPSAEELDRKHLQEILQPKEWDFYDQTRLDKLKLLKKIKRIQENATNNKDPSKEYTLDESFNSFRSSTSTTVATVTVAGVDEATTIIEPTTPTSATMVPVVAAPTQITTASNISKDHHNNKSTSIINNSKRTDIGGSSGSDNTQRFRLCLLLGLLFFLFGLLHMVECTRMKILLERNDKNDGWMVCFFKSVGVILLLASCGIIHFMFCDVLLIYSFHCIQFGFKPGRQLFQSYYYYQSNIRSKVAFFVGCIVLGSISKAILTAWFYTLTGLAIQVISGFLFWAQTILTKLLSTNYEANMDTTSSSVLSDSSMTAALLFLWDGSLWIYTHTIMVVQSILHFLMQLLNETFIGRAIKVTILDGWLTFFEMIGTTTHDVAHSLWRYHNNNSNDVDDIPLVSWRYDAFVTCWYLLSHTAIFLFALVFIFKLTTSSSSFGPSIIKCATATSSTTKITSQ